MRLVQALALLLFVFSGASVCAGEEFPSSYFESRQLFRASCPLVATAVLSCESFAVEPSLDLNVDVLWAKPAGSKKILVLVSGIHGIETFAGSAIQIDFLKSQLFLYQNAGISVLLVHALNPWGYVHLRRVTAQNIDLNRNFPSKKDPKSAPNPGFEKLQQLLAPEAVSGPGWTSMLGFSIKLLWKIATFEFTVDQMNQAVAGGQQVDPRGLFYGGQNTEPQVEWLMRLLDDKLQGFDEAVVMDLHTGLGQRGVLHLMPSDDPAPKGKALREKLFLNSDTKTPGPEIYQVTTASTKGFYTVAGDFLDFAEERGPNKLVMAAMTMEFGTKDTSIPAQLESLHTMVVENSSYQKQASDPRPGQKKFVELFSPQDLKWRSEVLLKSSQLFTQIRTRW